MLVNQIPIIYSPVQSASNDYWRNKPDRFAGINSNYNLLGGMDSTGSWWVSDWQSWSVRYYKRECYWHLRDQFSGGLFRRRQLRLMLHYGMPFIPHHIQAVGLAYFGQYLVKSSVSLEEAGLY